MTLPRQAMAVAWRIGQGKRRQAPSSPAVRQCLEGPDDAVRLGRPV